MNYLILVKQIWTLVVEGKYLWLFIPKTNPSGTRICHAPAMALSNKFALKGMAGINQNNQRSQSLCEVEIGRRSINIDTVEAHRLGDGWLTTSALGLTLKHTFDAHEHSGETCITWRAGRLLGETASYVRAPICYHVNGNSFSVTANYLQHTVVFPPTRWLIRQVTAYFEKPYTDMHHTQAFQRRGSPH